MSKHSEKIDIPVDLQPVFIDTAIFIYLLEDHPTYAPALAHLFNRIAEGTHTATTSVVTIAELLTKPYELGKIMEATHYRDLILHFPHLQVIPISEPIAVHAAHIRALHHFHLVDSLQLAGAHGANAKSFLTNDKKLTSYKDLPILYLDTLMR